MVDFATPYNGKNRKVRQYFELPSLTEQDYKDECDIGFIIENYVRTGQLPSQPTLSYQDCTTVMDYQDAQMLVAECKSNFEQLPSSERDRFKTVEGYLSFISDPKNLKESYERGLIDPSTVDLRSVYPERYVQVLDSDKTSVETTANPVSADVLSETQDVASKSSE